jgi:hypothetical protein
MIDAANISAKGRVGLVRRWERHFGCCITVDGVDILGVTGEGDTELVGYAGAVGCDGINNATDITDTGTRVIVAVVCHGIVRSTVQHHFVVSRLCVERLERHHRRPLRALDRPAALCIVLVVAVRLERDE